MLANVPIACQVRVVVNALVLALSLTAWCIVPSVAAPSRANATLDPIVAPAENLNFCSVFGSPLGSNALALVEEF